MRRAVKKLVFVFVCVLVSNGVLYTQEKSVSDIVEEAMPSVVLIVIYDKTGDIYGVSSPGKSLQMLMLLRMHIQLRSLQKMNTMIKLQF